jgi:ATP phosphoribosyltransferase regulatory subunit
MIDAGLAARRGAARAAASGVFAGAGYAPIEPPIFAAAETFLERLGERFRRQTCFFEDGTGHEMCLRPEITIPVCRMALETGYDGARPLRLHYDGPVFRLADDGAGALIQSAQAGAELLGVPDRAAADAEAVALAWQVLAACGVAQPTIALGDAGAFGDLITGLGLTVRQRERLKALFGAHGSALANHLPPEGATPPGRPLDLDLARANVAAELDARALTLTGGRTIDDIARRLADRMARAQAHSIPPEARAALAGFFALQAPLADAAVHLRGFFARAGVASAVPDHLAALTAALQARGVPLAAVTFDTGIHAPLDYYTGLEFRIDAGGETLAAGGRYDALFGQLGGPAIPAVGCAVFLDAVAAR